MKIVLTDKYLADLLNKNIEKDFTVTDITGMTLCVRKRVQSTAIHFQCKTSLNGKKTVYPLGQYPQLNLTAARTEYLRYIECIKNNEDPIKVVVNNNEDLSPTVEELWKKFTEMKYVNFKQATIDKYESLWNKHLYLYKDVKSSQLTPQKVMDIVKPYVDKKEYETAQKIAGAFRSLVDYAVFMEQLPGNPIARITSYIPKPKREHLATFKDDTMKEDMIKLFFDMSDTQFNLQCMFYCYFFTLLRAEELRSLRVDEVFNDYIVVKTKTLERFKQPLTKQAKQLIDLCIAKKKDIYSPYVFEASAGMGMFSENTLNHALDKRGYKGKLRTHGIRSLGRQWLQELPDTKESLIEMCLSHVGGNQVQQAYNRGEYIEERRKILQKWSDFVCECAGNNFNKLLTV